VAPGLAGAGPARAGGRRAGAPEPFPVELPAGFPVELPVRLAAGGAALPSRYRRPLAPGVPAAPVPRSPEIKPGRHDHAPGHGPAGLVADRPLAQGRFLVIPASRRRLVVLNIVVAALLVGLGGRLWYLQVMTGTAYASLARQDQVRNVIVPSVRGQILDDLGQPLVGEEGAALHRRGAAAVLGRVALPAHPGR
jgi:hypothetical protein